MRVAASFLAVGQETPGCQEQGLIESPGKIGGGFAARGLEGSHGIGTADFPKGRGRGFGGQRLRGLEESLQVRHSLLIAPVAQGVDDAGLEFAGGLAQGPIQGVARGGVLVAAQGKARDMGQPGVGEQVFKARRRPGCADGKELAAEEFLRVPSGRVAEQFEQAGFDLQAQGGVFGGLNHNLLDHAQRAGVFSILEGGDCFESLVEPVERVRRRRRSGGGNCQGKANEEQWCNSHDNLILILILILLLISISKPSSQARVQGSRIGQSGQRLASGSSRICSLAGSQRMRRLSQ